MKEMITLKRKKVIKERETKVCCKKKYKKKKTNSNNCNKKKINRKKMKKNKTMKQMENLFAVELLIIPLSYKILKKQKNQKK